jgi:hypothetical protein
LAGYADAFVTKLAPAGNATVYSTYLGGEDDDFGRGIALDSEGNAYVTGWTISYSPGFPTTTGAFQTANAGYADAFVTKLAPAGNATVYSTYLGGEDDDFGWGIAVDPGGSAYVTGETYSVSPGFPTTPGAFQAANAGFSNAFITKLAPAGNALVYSTYLGGEAYDWGFGIAVDSEGNAYVSGGTKSSSPGFPTTPDAFQTAFAGFADAFVTKLAPAGSALVYSTYLGGEDWDEGGRIALDSEGNAYVSGVTWSDGFPTTPGAFQTAFAGGTGDAFVTKIVARCDLTICGTAGGTVTTPGVGTYTYEKGTVVNLVATPNEGYLFVNWTGDVTTIAKVYGATTTITMNDNYSITANFFVSRCFIATAAYGTPMAEEIQILREFRDEYLLTNPVGQALVDLYYRVSPPMAEFITEHPSLKPIARVGLVPSVAMSTVAVNTTPAEKAVIIGLVVLVSVSLAVWATRRRGRGPEYT